MMTCEIADRLYIHCFFISPSTIYSSSYFFYFETDAAAAVVVKTKIKNLEIVRLYIFNAMGNLCHVFVYDAKAI